MVEVARQPGRVQWDAGQQGPRMGARFVHGALGDDNPTRQAGRIRFQAFDHGHAANAQLTSRCVDGFPHRDVGCVRGQQFASPNDKCPKSRPTIDHTTMRRRAAQRRPCRWAPERIVGQKRIREAVGRGADLPGACASARHGCRESRRGREGEHDRRLNEAAPGGAAVATEVVVVVRHLESNLSQSRYDASISCESY